MIARWVSAVSRRVQIRAPAPILRDLGHPVTENELADDAEYLFAVGQLHLPDREARGFPEEDRRDAVSRDRPYLDGDRGAASRDTDHRGMQVLDRPEAVDRRRPRLPDEPCTHGLEISIQREAAHQRSIDGEKHILLHHRPSV